MTLERGDIAKKWQRHSAFPTINILIIYRRYASIQDYGEDHTAFDTSCKNCEQKRIERKGKQRPEGGKRAEWDEKAQRENREVSRGTGKRKKRGR